MVILILSYKHGILLHVPQPMNVANTHIHSLLCDDIGFQLLALVVQAKNTGERSHGYVAKAEYGRVQLRLSEVLTRKPALFTNAKLVRNGTSLPQNRFEFPVNLL